MTKSIPKTPTALKKFRITKASELKEIVKIDPKLWTVLSAPTADQAIDERTLTLIDQNNDTRIRYTELCAAVEWILGLLTDKSTLNKNSDSLSPKHINPKHPDGHRILELIDKFQPKPETITLDTLNTFKESLPDFENDFLLLEKAIRLHKDIINVANNFITLTDFYANHKEASFQAGTLYMSGLSFQLTAWVNDLEAHQAIASKSGLFLIYCKLTSDNNEEKHIVAVSTKYNTNYIFEGISGIFNDRKGKQWDAKVVNIVENPTSLKDAILKPFKNALSLIKEQLNKITAKQKTKMLDSVENATTKPEAISTQNMGSILAGSAFAFAAISSSIAYVTTEIAKTDKLKLLYTSLGIIALILTPIAICAYLKLKTRNISILLQANGWAINPPIRLSLKIGRQLTKAASEKD